MRVIAYKVVQELHAFFISVEIKNLDLGPVTDLVRNAVVIVMRDGLPALISPMIASRIKAFDQVWLRI